MMNITFIFNNDENNCYSKQLNLAYKLLKKKNKLIKKVSLNNFDESLLRNVDIIICNNLSDKHIKLIKKNKIISIGINNKYSTKKYDISIDFKGKENSIFSGQEYLIPKDLQSSFDFSALFNIVSYLKWDTNFWGFPVATISSRKLTTSILHRVNHFVKKNNIKLLQYLCNCHDRKSVYLAENNDFKFKDIRITFEKLLDETNYCNFVFDKGFRKAKKNEVLDIQNISTSLYKDSRYFFDENFCRQKVQAFYKQWLYKSIHGVFDDLCLVLCINNRPVSYCTVKFYKQEKAIIGLFGVSKIHIGKGYGKKLLENVSAYLTSKKIKKIIVVTQGRNYKAQRLYQSQGFLTLRTELWYHKWV